MEWNLVHCWDILKNSPFVDYTPDAEKRDRVSQVESQARMERRSHQREHEAREHEAGARKARQEMEREARARKARQEWSVQLEFAGHGEIEQGPLQRRKRQRRG